MDPFDHCIDLIQQTRHNTVLDDEQKAYYRVLINQVEGYMCALLDQVINGRNRTAFFRTFLKTSFSKAFPFSPSTFIPSQCSPENVKHQPNTKIFQNLNAFGFLNGSQAKYHACISYYLCAVLVDHYTSTVS